MSDDLHIENTIKRLRPEWAQLMAGLVLRGWVIKPVDSNAGQFIHGPGAWTAYLQCDTADQLDIALKHKLIHGLRMYSAPSLLSLLQQMQEVLAEFKEIEGLPLPDLPDAANAARGGSDAADLPPQ